VHLPLLLLLSMLNDGQQFARRYVHTLRQIRQVTWTDESIEIPNDTVGDKN
jgi:hypothetical protein